MSKKLLVYDPKKDKKVLIGYLDGTVFTRVVSPKHFMNVVQGYGIQEIGFAELLELGAKRIVLNETRTGRRLHSSVQDWLDNGKVADYGHGKQRFLSVKFMNEKQKQQKLV